MGETKAGLAVITGASSGIGRIFAERLAAGGYNLVVVARRGHLLEGLAGEVRRAHGVEVEVLAADLQSSEGCAEVERVLERSETNFLINNAGYGKAGRLVHTEPTHASGQVGLNVMALTRLTCAAVHAFARRGQGSIINISSLAGFMPIPGLAVYAATKAYVRNFTLAVAEELQGSGVKVAAVCPGYTDTGFFDVAGFGAKLRGKAMNARDVVDIALERFEAGERLIIPGVSNQVLTQLGQHLPLRLASKLAGLVFRRQMQPE